MITEVLTAQPIDLSDLTNNHILQVRRYPSSIDAVYQYQYQEDEDYLPCEKFDSIWDSLIYYDDTLDTLLQYCMNILLFSKYSMNTFNRVILLHGQPGCGKSSLTKALAQKLTIRSDYEYGSFIEIHSQLLFSKYFAESSQLVTEKFDAIRKQAMDKQCLVVVVIDEVESLAAVRNNSEPTDALRVVNSLLTQIDSLATLINVLVITTTNLIDKVDGAFIDRADLKLHIKSPCNQAIYVILRNECQQLMQKGLLEETVILTLDEMLMSVKYGQSTLLWEIACQCEGLSGRFVKKLGVLAYNGSNYNAFMCSMKKVVQQEKLCRSQFTK